ncbi:MAG: RNA polymerase sigma-54 factor [Deltaproteobacteria bacterium]|nr:MAG: RNA polymerase sigma-54 factor [Deltaproteobacteria bacterium]
MGLEIKHNLRLQQQLKITITPQLQQAIRLLQLTRLELQQAIRNELEQNPVLEEVIEEPKRDTEGEEIPLDTKVEGDGKESSDEPDYESLIPEEPYYGSYTAVGGEEDSEGRPYYENTLRVTPSLADHLMAQLTLDEFDDEERKIGTFIIGNIDDDGFLRITTEEVAEELGVPVERVEDVLREIQHFDPTGVGARSVQECLLVQAEEKFGLLSDEYLVLRDHYDAFLKGDISGISRSLGKDEEEVREIFRNIATLDPKPARNFSSSETHYVTPDIFVFKVGGEWVIELNEDGLPKLRINSFYRELIKKRDTLSKEEREYLKEKVNSAVWFIKSIYQRKKTIYRVMESILKRQIDFFEKGPGHLKPLTLKDVAEDIEMHESTVSRVTSGKYVQTPHGLFELKYFFTGGLSRRDGEAIASESVKEKIKELIKNEDPSKPLSDIQIARILKSQGINIARRTVTKYRESLGILPSNRRKKIF